jgi:hypothetical protein
MKASAAYTRAIQRAVASEKFRSWRSSKKAPSVLDYTGDSFREVGGSWHSGPEPKPDLASEPHRTPAELGKTWGLSDDTIRELFKNETGVLCIGDNGSRKKRKYISMRIPESVAVRVHARLSAKALPVK